MSEKQFKIKCPKCLQLLKFTSKTAGKTIKCPSCETLLKLPGAPSQKPDEVTSSPAGESDKTNGRWKKPATELIQKAAKNSSSVISNVSSAVLRTPNHSASELPSVPPSLPDNPNPLPANQLSEAALANRQHELARFMDAGQDVQMIIKLYNRVGEICTSSEEIKYMAVQQHPVANVAPDAVVLTNRRVIIFRQKILGRLDFLDVRWLDVKDVHVKEGVLRSTLSIQGINGHVEKVEHMPKAQARKVYRIGQEMEEEMIEFRRDRSMEEDRNRASNIVVNTAVAPSQAVNPTPPETKADDPVSRLKTLKEMSDAGLLSDAEFAAKKAQIMDEL